MAFSRGQPAWGAHLAEDLERIVALHDASNIAAVIVEPVAGSTGVLVPPQGYLEKLRAICDKHGLLLIFDEVITGFGRTGQAFAAQTFGVTPDMITFAKGVTSGAVPMAGVIVSRTVHDTVVNGGAPGSVEFPHGYTYSGTRSPPLQPRRRSRSTTRRSSSSARGTSRLASSRRCTVSRARRT
jgi:beta-alanine--pyruvate transaminase